jgi:hypothetical protein
MGPAGLGLNRKHARPSDTHPPPPQGCQPKGGSRFKKRKQVAAGRKSKGGPGMGPTVPPSVVGKPPQYGKEGPGSATHHAHQHHEEDGVLQREPQDAAHGSFHAVLCFLGSQTTSAKRVPVLANSSCLPKSQVCALGLLLRWLTALFAVWCE